MRGSRGVNTVPMAVSFDRGGGGYRGRGDRRHSGPSGYHHQHQTNGNHPVSYNGGGYRGRGRPFSGHGPTHWSASYSAERLNGHSRGGFGRGGRYDNNRGRGFDTRSRGPSGDNVPHKYYANYDVRPARGTTAQARPRGFYHSSTSSAPHFPWLFPQQLNNVSCTLPVMCTSQSRVCLRNIGTPVDFCSDV